MKQKAQELGKKFFVIISAKKQVHINLNIISYSFQL